MKPAKEKAIVKYVLANLDREPSWLIRSGLFQPLLVVVTAAAVVAILSLGGSGILPMPLLSICAMAFGAILAVTIVYISSTQQWRALRGHVNRQSLERRLHELET
jgi:hypothetical protein